METLDSGRNRPLRSTQTRRSTTTYEWQISCSFTEEVAASFRLPQPRRRDLRFTPVETLNEFYEHEAVKNSSDEEFYDFDDGDPRTGRLQNQQVFLRKARNGEPYRTPCDKMSPPQRDEERIRRKGVAQKEKYSPNHSQCQGKYSQNQVNFRDGSNCEASYLPDQANSRVCSHYKTSCSPNQAKLRGYSRYQASCSPMTNTRGSCLPHRVQHRNEGASRQTIRSSVYLQQNMLNMQLEETGPAKRRNELSDRAVTTLPPIQQRRAMAARPHQFSHGRHEEQPSQLLAPGRRCGRQEASEERNSYYCKNRRIGICKETDKTQEHRTFVRVLGKRF